MSITTRYARHAIVRYISANPPAIHSRIAERRRQVKARQAAQRAVEEAGEGGAHGLGGLLLIAEQIRPQLGARHRASRRSLDLNGALGGDSIGTSQPMPHRLMAYAKGTACRRDTAKSFNRTFDRAHSAICQLLVADTGTLNVQLQAIECNS